MPQNVSSEVLKSWKYGFLAKKIKNFMCFLLSLVIVILILKIIWKNYVWATNFSFPKKMYRFSTLKENIL